MKEYIIDLICMMLALTPIYLAARYLQLRRRVRRLSAQSGTKVKLKFNKVREISLALFAIFMVALLAFVWQGEYARVGSMLQLAKERLETREGINLVPFRTIRNYYRVFGIGGDLFWVNIMGNILMFVPWGFGLLFLWKRNRNIFRFLYFSAMLPILIECSQLFINRQVDTDDFILNFAGGMLGGLLYWVLSGIFPKLKEIAL